jgi:hypothetical protein
MKTSVETSCSREASSLLLLVFAFTACLLGGCTSLMPATRAGAAETAETELSPLEYYSWARTASENDLLVELYGLELTISTRDPVISAVRKSIIFSSSELADTKTQQQATSLLGAIAGLEAIDGNSRAYRLFGEVLLSIQQQRGDLRAANALNQRALREIDTLKSRNSELQQQIEELTRIERQIIERERLNTQEP